MGAQLTKQAVTSRGNGLIFLSVFCMFWVFAGYLSYLPFRINEVDPVALTVLVGRRVILDIALGLCLP